MTGYLEGADREVVTREVVTQEAWEGSVLDRAEQMVAACDQKRRTLPVGPSRETILDIVPPWNRKLYDGCGRSSFLKTGLFFYSL